MKINKDDQRKVTELISDGIFTLQELDSTNSSEDFIYNVNNCSAFRKYFSLMTKSALNGSEKQISWANKIRSSYAGKKAYEMVITLIATKLKLDDTDFNKYAKIVIGEFNHTNSSWWIDNRYTL